MVFIYLLTRRNNLLACTIVLMMAAAACAPKYSPTPAPNRLLPELETGTATLSASGGVVENFYLNFTSLGNVPIEEYGIVYAFLPDTTAVNLVVGSSYPTAKFKNAPRMGANKETFNIALPSGMHALSYRAYARVVGGEVRYAPNRINKTY